MTREPLTLAALIEWHEKCADAWEAIVAAGADGAAQATFHREAAALLKTERARVAELAGDYARGYRDALEAAAVKVEGAGWMPTTNLAAAIRALPVPSGEVMPNDRVSSGNDVTGAAHPNNADEGGRDAT